MFRLHAYVVPIRDIFELTGGLEMYRARAMARIVRDYSQFTSLAFSGLVGQSISCLSGCQPASRDLIELPKQ